MTKREHFERWIKFLKPIAPDLSLEFNEERGFYLDPRVNLAYEAWLASPKTRPTENGRATKEQLAAMKADTSDIVDHLRGIYPGIADAYPVTQLMMKAADEIDRLRETVRMLEQDNSNLYERDRYHMIEISRLEMDLSNKKPAEAG